MRLNTSNLHNIKIPRNDVVAGYKNAYINMMISSARFKNKFLDCWDGTGEFSLFTNAKREAMTKLLGIDKQFNGETDLATTQAHEGLEDLRLNWKFNPASVTASYKETVLDNIRHLFETNGYSVTYRTETSPLYLNDVAITDPTLNLVYRLVINILNVGFGTYIFTFAQIETQLSYKIFDEKNTIDFITKSTTGIPELATLGLIKEDIETLGGVGSMHNWSFNDGTINIDPVEFAALPPDEFMVFVQNFINLHKIEEDQSWWQTILKIVMIIVSIIAIVYGGYALAAYAVGGSTVGLAGAAALGLTTMAYGAAFAAVFLAFQIYSAIMTLQSMTEKAEEAVDSPKEIDTKIAMAEEGYWTYHDSDKPENQINGVLEWGKP